MKKKTVHIFNYHKLAEMSWDNSILKYVALINEYKGRQELYIRQKSVELERLVEVARAQSTEASNRIEGIVTTNARLRNYLRTKQRREIAMSKRFMAIETC